MVLLNDKLWPNRPKGEAVRKVDEALKCFESGFNCSQSIFSTYAPLFDVDQNTALKIAAGFGGGIGSMGRTCGAVTGAFMVLGLKYGNFEPNDETAKAEKKSHLAEFVEKFRAQHRTVTCRNLLECDISTAEGMQYARAARLFTNRCPLFIKTAAEILEEILDNGAANGNPA